jgi:hypothetical protein
MQRPRGKKIGASRRELEWTLQGMLRSTPSEPQALVRHLGEVMIALIEQNNAALAAHLAPPADEESGAG